MFYISIVILLNLIIITREFNLYYTDLLNQSNSVLQYNCLRIVTISGEKNINRYERYLNYRETNVINNEIMLYCMNEFSSKFNIEEKIIDFPKLTFEELSKENVSIEQLYLWSAPIDLIENYQFYLNKFDLSLSKEIFYNCTLPRFGPRCQYQFYSNNLSLSELIHQYYIRNESNPNSLTCYEHLKCSSSSCLDWTEICDGKIDCVDDGLDEEHCWKVEVNQCNDNEYRCLYGQCIPKIFYQDGQNIFDCIDASDETLFRFDITNLCHKNEPRFGCEDRICKGEPLTSSCVNKRESLLMKSMFYMKDNSISEQCWFLIKCMFNRLDSEESFCRELYAEDLRLKSFLNTCPEMLYIANYPILFDDTYITIKKIQLEQMINNQNFNFSVFLSYGRDNIPIIEKDSNVIDYIYGIPNKFHLALNCTSLICNRSSMYQCMNSSKCISIHRLFNGYHDCPHSDDETMPVININPNIIKQLNKTHFYCQPKNRYYSQNFINDRTCDCLVPLGPCLDENVGDIDSSNDILFQTICDRFQELLPILINNKSETDETECEEWECDNIYTHCDGVWNCFNGEDEIGCDDLSRSMCSFNQHLCVSILTNRFICLNIDKANDGNIDCVGGTDERKLIIYPTRLNGLFDYRDEFSCMNQIPSPGILPLMLCNGENTCKHGDDENFCETDQKNFNHRGICLPDNINFGSNAEKFLCAFLHMKTKRSIVHFKLKDMIHSVSKMISPIEISPKEHKSGCHRGLSLRVNEINEVCLCPPSYYGSNCEYQNERISLAIQFRCFSDSWQTQFVIILLLIDDSDQRIIHSYEQINYLSLKNCRTKFQFYLLYSRRPKDLTKNYSIHIDFYEKKSLIHRGSLLIPILFPFLPVYRLALIVDIPRTNNTKSQICSDKKCIHGKCIKYSNYLTFCQCDSGWSGKSCQIRYECRCSSDSLCIGISSINNRSICVCPLNKFGPRCLFTINRKCQINNNETICKNGGECISNNDDLILNEELRCICPEGYSGHRCQIIDNQISLSFSKNIILSQEIFIHFIEIIENGTHIRSTTFRRISFREDSINISWSQPFHIVFIDISNKTYYLIVVQNNYIQSLNMSKMINESSRCPHINQLFNKTFIQLDLIRRIKYYNLPCQNQSLNLSCFYDDIQFCLCDQFNKKRLANCFHFDHNMKFNCSGQNECENDGECFQDHPQCPTKSICMCPSCYFGQRCQLTTNGFGLSLDVILGYQIFPHIIINDQSLIIKLSLSLTIIFIIAEFVNGIICIITFMNKNVCEVGCGLYLLSTSITSLLTIIIFGLKYFILLYSHMSMITNQSFLSGQCYSLDFILRIFLSLDQWLNAFIAIERTITVIKGAAFNKKKSEKRAKLMIIILLIMISVSYIHDPIHRKLLEEINNVDIRQNRIWCIVNYSSNLKIYNSFIHTFHFLGPFIINFLSVIILILKKTRQQSDLHKKELYKDILYKTIKEHKQLLTAPIVLIILGFPRLILLFISRCMKSADDVWLFLCGYFISFIPPMLTFLIFILPSTFYKDIFCKTFKQYKISILRWFGLVQ